MVRCIYGFSLRSIDEVGIERKVHNTGFSPPELRKSSVMSLEKHVQNIFQTTFLDKNEQVMIDPFIFDFHD